MKVISIQVGLPKTIAYNGKDITTAIWKQPIDGPVMIRKLNLDGDQQADLKVHGGVDKAVYAYSQDAYPTWKRVRPTDSFEPGAMGENLSVDVFSESDIGIGDIYELGDCVLQVAQPRLPCYKLAAKFNDGTILKQFMKVNRPGIYFRVLKEGLVDKGQPLKLVTRETLRVPVVELFQLAYQPPTPERAREILKLMSLTPGWRRDLEKHA